MAKSTGLSVAAIAVAIAIISWFAGSAIAGHDPRTNGDIRSSVGREEPRNGVTVQGQGRVVGVPDVLRLDIGVEVRRASVQDALDVANSKAARVTAALRRSGVDVKDIQTTSLAINTDYDYSGKTPRLRGYVVSNRVRTKIRDLKRAGATIQAAASAGGNDARIDGVSFDLEDNVALLKAARDAAFADAKTKAEQYAKLTGRRLGEVASVSETVSSTPPSPITYDYAAPATRAAVPVSPGQQEISVLVTVIYDFA